MIPIMVEKNTKLLFYYLDMAQLGDQNVLGLQITITEATLVQKIHRCHDFAHNEPTIRWQTHSTKHNLVTDLE